MWSSQKNRQKMTDSADWEISSRAFGNAIKRMREAAGISQAQVQTEIFENPNNEELRKIIFAEVGIGKPWGIDEKELSRSIAQNAIARIETGRTKNLHPEVLKALARLFDTLIASKEGRARKSQPVQELLTHYLGAYFFQQFSETGLRQKSLTKVRPDVPNFKPFFVTNVASLVTNDDVIDWESRLADRCTSERKIELWICAPSFLEGEFDDVRREIVKLITSGINVTYIRPKQYQVRPFEVFLELAARDIKEDQSYVTSELGKVSAFTFEEEEMPWFTCGFAIAQFSDGITKPEGYLLVSTAQNEFSEPEPTFGIRMPDPQISNLIKQIERQMESKIIQRDKYSEKIASTNDSDVIALIQKTMRGLYHEDALQDYLSKEGT